MVYVLLLFFFFFFFKQNTAYEMRISDWSSDVCSSDLLEDDQGMAAGLIKASGGDAATAVRETDAALAKVPAVSGSGAQTTPGLDNDSVRVLDQAEQVAQEAGDSYVTVERLQIGRPSCRERRGQ